MGPGGPGTYVIGQGTIPPATCTISETDTGSDGFVQVSMIVIDDGILVATGTTSVTFTSVAGGDLVIRVTNAFALPERPEQPARDDHDRRGQHHDDDHHRHDHDCDDRAEWWHHDHARGRPVDARRPRAPRASCRRRVPRLVGCSSPLCWRCSVASCSSLGPDASSTRPLRRRGGPRARRPRSRWALAPAQWCHGRGS